MRFIRKFQVGAALLFKKSDMEDCILHEMHTTFTVALPFLIVFPTDTSNDINDSASTFQCLYLVKIVCDISEFFKTHSNMLILMVSFLL